MLRRSPCEYYLKYLLLRPERHTNDAIVDLIRRQHLDFIGMPYLERLRATCRPPEPFYPHNRLHQQSVRFLRQEELYDIFHPKSDMQLAVSWVQQPRLKEMLETGLAAGNDWVWIARLLRGEGTPATSEAIALYHHYFFNTHIVDSTELRVALKLRFSPLPGRDVDEMRAAEIWEKVSYTDPRRIVVKTSITPVAALFTKLRYGQLPGNVELQRLAEAARFASLAKAVEAMVQGAPPEQAREYVTTAQMLTELLENISNPEEDLRKGLSAIVLKHDERSIPELSVLSGGQHTKEVQKIVELERRKELEGHLEYDDEISGDDSDEGAAGDVTL